jgi:hypothetical protein
MSPAPTFLPKIKKTRGLVRESIRAEVIARNGTKAVLGTASGQRPLLISTMLATRDGVEGAFGARPPACIPNN